MWTMFASVKKLNENAAFVERHFLEFSRIG